MRNHHYIEVFGVLSNCSNFHFPYRLGPIFLLHYCYHLMWFDFANCLEYSPNQCNPNRLISQRIVAFHRIYNDSPCSRRYDILRLLGDIDRSVHLHRLFKQIKNSMTKIYGIYKKKYFYLNNRHRRHRATFPVYIYVVLNNKIHYFYNYPGNLFRRLD